MITLATCLTVALTCAPEPAPPEPIPARLTVQQVHQLIVNAGFPEEHWKVLGRIVKCESGRRPSAVNVNKKGKWKGSRDLGLWQINDTIWKELVASGDPFNPADNTRMAKRIYDIQGLNAWVCYTKAMI